MKSEVALRRVQVDRLRVRPLPGGAGPVARARHRATIQRTRAERAVTALVDASEFNNRGLLYIPRYLRPDHPDFGKSDED